MSNSLSSNPENNSRNQDKTKTIPSTLLCICCLEREVPYINILTCSHVDFLNTFTIPEIKPKKQVICYHCHDMLKKIKLFKLQVEDSFKILTEKGSPPECSNKINNLKIHKMLNINILQINNKENEKQENNEINKIIKQEKGISDDKQNKEKSVPPKSLNHTNNKKLKNIQDALNIINGNQNNGCIDLLTASLQSLSESILSDNLNNLHDSQLLNKIITKPTKNSNSNTESVDNNATDNILNNTDDNSLLIKRQNVEKKRDEIPSEIIDVDINIVNEELQSSVIIVEDEVTDVSGENNMESDEPVAKERPSSFELNIRKVKLTREELMQERSKAAYTQLHLRYRCDSCLISFHYKENLDDHKKRKHSERPGTINCDVCLQSLNPGASYDDHAYWHYIRFECLSCGQRFMSYDEAFSHFKRKHSKQTVYKCQYCPYKTPVIKNYRIHLRNHRVCQVCGICCVSVKMLKTHMTAKHDKRNTEKRSSTQSTTQIRVRLPYLNKTTSTEETQANRSDIKTYKCEHCDKAFYFAKNLRKHTMLLHSKKLK